MSLYINVAPGPWFSRHYVAITFCLLVIIEQRRAWVGGSLGCAKQPGATVSGVELETMKYEECKN